MEYETQSRLDHLGLHQGFFNQKSKTIPKWCSWGLVASLSVNVAVVAFLVFQIQEGTLWFEVETQDSITYPTSEIARSDSLKSELLQLNSQSDQEVIEALGDEKVVANGYRLQELALAVLHSRGYQLEDPLRPLSAWPQPLSTLSWTQSDGQPVSFQLFSNIQPQEIQAIKKYLTETMVPLSAEGILKRIRDGNDQPLMRAALLRTDEWFAFSRIFSDLSEEDKLLVAKDIGGEAFTSIVEWSHTHNDSQEFGPFIVTLFSKVPSASLAEVVASHFADHVMLQASDDAVLLLYSYLPPKSEAGVRLAMRLLHGQRKLPVWQASQAYLARAACMPTLSSMNREQVLAWFQQLVRPDKVVVAPQADCVHAELLPQRIQPLPPTSVPATPASSASVPVAKKSSSQTSMVSSRAATRQLKPYRIYTVRKGDTLWAIAHRFNVDVEKLKYLNGLKGTTLPPGKTLRIPH